MGTEPAGVICGRVLDGAGRPPQRGWFTVLREVETDGRRGFVGESGDHDVGEDGRFCSPPLLPGRYVVRFAGVLERATVEGEADGEVPPAERRSFDFLYPNACHVDEATVLPVEAGPGTAEIEVTVAAPVLRRVEGRVRGAWVPEEGGHLALMLARDVGSSGAMGGIGGPRVGLDGAFTVWVQQGRYDLEVWEFAAPDEDGRRHVAGRRRAGAITVGDRDVEGLTVWLRDTGNDGGRRGDAG